jgi:hypothetical protein
LFFHFFHREQQLLIALTSALFKPGSVLFRRAAARICKVSSTVGRSEGNSNLEEKKTRFFLVKNYLFFFFPNLKPKVKHLLSDGFSSFYHNLGNLYNAFTFFNKVPHQSFFVNISRLPVVMFSAPQTNQQQYHLTQVIGAKTLLVSLLNPFQSRIRER